MHRYEYNVVPAPRKGKKAKGIKGAEARFAHAVAECMNEMAADGWEYLRSDTLPCEERTGLTGRTTTFQTMLVFRREATGAAVSIGRSVEEMAGDHVPRLPSATQANTMAEAVENAALAEADEDEPTRIAAATETETETKAEDAPEKKDGATLTAVK